MSIADSPHARSGAFALAIGRLPIALVASGSLLLFRHPGIHMANEIEDDAGDNP